MQFDYKMLLVPNEMILFDFDSASFFSFVESEEEKNKLKNINYLLPHPPLYSSISELDQLGCLDCVSRTHP